MIDGWQKRLLQVLIIGAVISLLLAWIITFSFAAKHEMIQSDVRSYCAAKGYPDIRRGNTRSDWYCMRVKDGNTDMLPVTIDEVHARSEVN